jgi:hypothetical protein
MTSPGTRFRLAHTLIVIAALSAVAFPAAQQAQQPPPKPAPADPHQQMNMRGNEVMGFDQDKTAHHFLLFDDGGAIDVSVKAADDTKNRDAIRSHLPHIAMMFGNGDFSAPMLVHSTDVPGTRELASFKDKVRYTYVETPRGGRVDIVTSDKAALDAVHKFLRFQIADHKTSDTGKVEKRQVAKVAHQAR